MATPRIARSTAAALLLLVAGLQHEDVRVVGLHDMALQHALVDRLGEQRQHPRARLDSADDRLRAEVDAEALVDLGLPLDRQMIAVLRDQHQRDQAGPGKAALDHAGDKGFVDYSGDKLHIVDPQTGECRPVELFVGALGASSYTFADVTMTQSGPDFLASHVRMLEFFGGVPAALVPDQLKSGVTRSCWYDPQSSRR